MAKDFNDFATGLQEVHFQMIAASVNEMGLRLSLPLTEENIGQFITAIITANTKVTLELLEAYHDWNSRPNE